MSSEALPPRPTSAKRPQSASRSRPSSATGAAGGADPAPSPPPVPPIPMTAAATETSSSSTAAPRAGGGSGGLSTRFAPAASGNISKPPLINPPVDDDDDGGIYDDPDDEFEDDSSSDHDVGSKSTPRPSGLAPVVVAAAGVSTDPASSTDPSFTVDRSAIAHVGDSSFTLNSPQNASPAAAAQQPTSARSLRSSDSRPSQPQNSSGSAQKPDAVGKSSGLDFRAAEPGGMARSQSKVAAPPSELPDSARSARSDRQKNESKSTSQMNQQREEGTPKADRRDRAETKKEDSPRSARLSLSESEKRVDGVQQPTHQQQQRRSVEGDAPQLSARSSSRRSTPRSGRRSNDDPHASDAGGSKPPTPRNGDAAGGGDMSATIPLTPRDDAGDSASASRSRRRRHAGADSKETSQRRSKKETRDSQQNSTSKIDAAPAAKKNDGNDAEEVASPLIPPSTGSQTPSKNNTPRTEQPAAMRSSDAAGSASSPAPQSTSNMDAARSARRDDEEEARSPSASRKSAQRPKQIEDGRRPASASASIGAKSQSKHHSKSANSAAPAAASTSTAFAGSSGYVADHSRSHQPAAPRTNDATAEKPKKEKEQRDRQPSRSPHRRELCCIQTQPKKVPLPKAHGWAAAQIGKNVLLHGGTVSGSPTNVIFAYNTATCRIKSLGTGSVAGASHFIAAGSSGAAANSKPPPVTGHTLTAIQDGKLVALIGGGSESVHQLHLASLGWTKVDRSKALAGDAWKNDPRDPNDRRHHAAVAFEGRVYVFGGLTKRGKTNLVDMYVPQRQGQKEAGTATASNSKQQKHATVSEEVDADDSDSAARWEPMSTPAADGRAPGAVCAEAVAGGSVALPVSHLTAVAFAAHGVAVVYGGKDALGDATDQLATFDFATRRFQPVESNHSHGGALAKDASDAENSEDNASSGTSAASASAPGARFGHVAVAHEATSTMWIVGGTRGGMEYLADVWGLDVLDYIWRRVDVAGAVPRAYAAVAIGRLRQRRAAGAGGEAAAGDGSSGDESEDEHQDDDGAEGHNSADPPPLLLFGGGALPVSTGSGYAQLAFTASAAIVGIGRYTVSPDATAGDAAATAATGESNHIGNQARGRPSTAPLARRAASGAPTSAPAVRDRRPRQPWMLCSDFPTPPPVPGRRQHSPDGAADTTAAATDPPKIRPETLRRLCPSKKDQEAKLEKLRDQVQPLYTSNVKRTKAQVEEAATRMCNAEMKARAKHREELLKKVLVPLQQQHQPAVAAAEGGASGSGARTRLTPEEEEMLSQKLYAGDMARYKNAHAKAHQKYGFHPPPRKRSPCTAEELNKRFYASRPNQAARIAALRAKHMPSPPRLALTSEELAGVVSRLSKVE